MTEIWKWVPGYEDRYEVSNLGNLRSWVSPNGRGGRISDPRPVKTTRNYAGYHVVTLRSTDGAKSQYRVHRIVLELFVGACPSPDHQAAHHNDDKDDNSAGNLAWKTVEENTVDRHVNQGTARKDRHGSYKHGKFVGTNRKYYPPKFVGHLPVR